MIDEKNLQSEKLDDEELAHVAGGVVSYPTKNNTQTESSDFARQAAQIIKGGPCIKSEGGH